MKLVDLNPSMRRWIFASLIISSIYIALAAAMPSLSPHAPHDDTLFQKLAVRIASDEWLGYQYGPQTLAKGPFHSIQMSLAYRLGIHPGLWLSGLYLFSAWTFCTLALASTTLWLRVMGYIAFLCDPWQFTSFGLRLLREETYIPFMLFALSFLIAALDRIPVWLERQIWPRWLISRGLLAFLLLSGLSFGLLLITREARIIVYTILILSIVSIGVRCYSFIKVNPKSTLRLLALASVFLLLVPVPAVMVGYQNHSSYGLFITNEFEDGGFKAFYQDLISVSLPGQQAKPWVPIQMQTIRQLQSSLPNSNLSKVLSNLNPGWQKFGCEQHAEMCGEYGGGWLMWALRDSLFDQSMIVRPDQLQPALDELRQEIKNICLSEPNQFNCKKRAWGYLPYLSRWGHKENPAFLLLRDISVKIKGAISPAFISYPPAVYDDSKAQSKWARKLGVHMAVTQQEQRRWSRHVNRLYYFAMGCRAALLMAILSILILNLARVKSILVDSGGWLIVAAFMLQVGILSLIELTSFHAGGYLVLVSPLITAILCRAASIALIPTVEQQ